MNEKLTPVDTCSATVMRAGKIEEKTGARGHFDVVCHGPDGTIKWVDEIENQVMNEGKNYILDNAFAGSAFTTTGPRMGLVTNTSFTAYAAGDTYPLSGHPGWAESAFAGNRQAMTFSASAGGTKAANSVVFSITGTDTVRGCAVFFSAATGVNDTTASDTTHRVLSGGDFTGGNKTVGNGDTITVTYSFAI